MSDRLLPANGKEEEGDVVEEMFEMEVERERSKTTRLGWSRILTVTMICLLTACLFADQNLMAPNLTAISQEFSFTPQVHVLKLLYNLTGCSATGRQAWRGGSVRVLPGWCSHRPVDRMASRQDAKEVVVLWSSDPRGGTVSSCPLVSWLT